MPAAIYRNTNARVAGEVEWIVRETTRIGDGPVRNVFLQKRRMG